MSKGKKTAQPEAIPLAEGERLITVLFHAQFPDSPQHSETGRDPLAELRNAFLYANVGGEGKLVSVTEALSSESMASGGNGGAAAHARSAATATPSVDAGGGDCIGCVVVQVLEQRIWLDLVAVETLCDAGRVHSVAVYLPPPPLAEPAVEAPGPSLAGGNSNAKRGKQQQQLSAAAAGQQTVAKGGGRGDKRKVNTEDFLSRGECMGRVVVSFIDLLHTTHARYAFDDSTGLAVCGTGVKCWIELTCTDEPLMPVSLVGKYRPALFTIHSVSGLPYVAPARTEMPSKPAQEVSLDRGEDGTAVEIVATLRCLGHALTVRFPARGDSGGDVCRALVMLGSSSPLEVYQCAALEPAELSLQHANSRLPIGSGTFSLRSLATDGQTYFNECVQLLPSRATLAMRETCLTTACTASISVDFIMPLPILRHVNEMGDPTQKQFLTRAVIVMPYAAPWTEKVVSQLLREMCRCSKAMENVYTYVEPVPEPSQGDSEEISLAQSKTSKGKKSKSDGKRQQQQQQGSSSPPPPSLPQTEFEQPFTVVCPAGISGFEVMDGELRLLCVEGRLAEVHRIVETATRAADLDPQLRVLLNSELFLPRRAYLIFPPLVTPPASWKPTAAAEPPAETPEVPVAAGSSMTAAPAEAGPLSPIPSMVAPQGELAEAGGTGGRIHRIRLREAISSLALQQRYLLRRTLSKGCLSCLQRLRALSECHTLRDAAERGLFPTAADLISLERSFGQTLNLFDIFGKEEFVNVEDSVGALSTSEAETHTTHSYLAPLTNADVDPAQLVNDDVGRLVSFQGVLAGDSTRAVPREVTQRYKCGLWMALGDGRRVLCAFPRGTPGGTVHYHVEGQVARCGDVLVLYVLEFHPLVRGATTTSNPHYEAHLRDRKRCEFEFAAWLTGRRHGNSGATGVVSMGSQPAAASRAPVTADSSDDDDDAHHPPKVEGDDEAAAVAADVRSYEALYESRCLAMKGTRTSRMRERVSRAKKAAGEEVDPELLWEMYDERAPKDTSAHVAPRGPPLHYW